MISWIQTYLQQHLKTIFALLLAVTIISFIFTIGAAPGIGNGNRQYVERPFFGHNLASADDLQRVLGDANLSASLQMGSMSGLDNDQIQQYAFQRTAALTLADKWDIPPATNAEITEAVKKLRMFSGPNGEFDAKAYATFRDNLKNSQRGVTEAEIARVIGDDVRVEKVNQLIAGPGYVLPRDVKTQLERSDTTWTLATATADYAAFKPDIKPTDAELTKFFEDNSIRYEIPPRVVATYVEFPSSQFVPTVKVTDAEVRAYYDMNPARFPKPPEVKAADAKTPPKPSNPDADFAAVKQSVQAALVLERAQKQALQAASDLAVAIFEAKATTPEVVEGLLSSRKLKQKSLAPFTHDAGPAEFGHTPEAQEIANEAFKLNKSHFVSDALASPTGAIVLFWKDLEPAHKPMFAEVREKVRADYVQNERQKRFVELGKTARAHIEARLKAGDSFEKAVASAASSSGLKLTVKALTPFSMRTRPQDVDYTVLGALDHLDKGEVSEMLTTPGFEKGIFVYAVDKKLPNLAENTPQYTEMRSQIASMSARVTANSYMTELVDHELKKSEPKPE